MSGGTPDSGSNRPEPKKTTATSVAKFAGMGAQLAVAIGLGAMAGMKVDEHLAWDQPVGTAVFSLLGLAAGMYQILRSLL
ncbi:MAG: AtpZ/AtpI family protein [Flavobacteriales bacterium]